MTDSQKRGREIGGEAAAVLSQIWEAPNILQLPPSLDEIFSNSITRRLPADNGYCTTPCRTQNTLPWMSAEAATQETAGSDSDELLLMARQRPQVHCRSVSQDPANNGRLIFFGLPVFLVLQTPLLNLNLVRVCTRSQVSHRPAAESYLCTAHQAISRLSHGTSDPATRALLVQGG